MEALWQDRDFQILCKTDTDRTRIRKKLQRSRKFDLLVAIFGDWVLDAVPQVCISRLDSIRIEALEGLRSGSVEQIRVLRIKGRAMHF